ncbi:HIT domain-containing protein [Hydrogenimonas sp.]
MIYKDADIYIEWEESEIPWIKIFTCTPYKEITECPKTLRAKLWKTYEIAEETMIEYFKPDKINMASFGNYMPRVHIHVMARFENDSFFPEPMWGERQREGNVVLPDFALFEAILLEKLRRI